MTDISPTSQSQQGRCVDGSWLRKMMSEELLSAKEAARCLGIAVTSLYGWLGQSKQGLLVIRGQGVSISYLQGGAKGQGRIKIETSEVERLKDLMRVRPQRLASRSIPVRQTSFPGITVKLGRPEP